MTWSTPSELSEEFVQQVLKHQRDPEALQAVVDEAQEWPQRLEATSEHELMQKIVLSCTLAMGRLIAVIGGMRVVSPLAEEFAQRLLEGLAVEDLIEDMRRKGEL